MSATTKRKTFLQVSKTISYHSIKSVFRHRKMHTLGIKMHWTGKHADFHEKLEC